MSECAVCGRAAGFRILSTGDELCAACRENYRTLVGNYKIADRETLLRSLSSRLFPARWEVNAIPNPPATVTVTTGSARIVMDGNQQNDKLSDKIIDAVGEIVNLDDAPLPKTSWGKPRRGMFTTLIKFIPGEVDKTKAAKIEAKIKRMVVNQKIGANPGGEQPPALGPVGPKRNPKPSFHQVATKAVQIRKLAEDINFMTVPLGDNPTREKQAQNIERVSSRVIDLANEIEATADIMKNPANPPGGEWAVTWRPLDSDTPKGGAGFPTQEAAERWARARGITESDNQLRVFKTPGFVTMNPMTPEEERELDEAVKELPQPFRAAVGPIVKPMAKVGAAVAPSVVRAVDNPGNVSYYVEKFKMKMGKGTTPQVTESWVNGIGDATPGQKVEILRQIQNWQLGASRNPEGSSAKFDHHRQIPPPCFHYDSFKTVPLRHTRYPRKGRYSVPGALAVVGRIRKGCLKKFGEPGKRVGYLQWGVQSILTPKGAGLKVTRGESAMENPAYYGVLATAVYKFGKRFHSYTEWAKEKFGVMANPAKAMVMKEKKEHPWMTMAQAEQVATDHEENPKRPKKPLGKGRESAPPVSKIEETETPETEPEKKKKKRNSILRYWETDETAMDLKGA
jgi:hypothetical protein